MDAAAAETAAKKKTRRTKMVRMKQEYIDGVLKHYPFKPFPSSPEEIAKRVSSPVIREQLRVMLADAAARVKASRDKDEAILAQYFAKGYAEEEVEASDGGDEEEVMLEDTAAEAPQGPGEPCMSKL